MNPQQNPDTDQMTPEESAFFDRMKTAPQAQRDSFRAALAMLMNCYGDKATGGIVAFYVDRQADSTIMTINSVNLDADEAVFVAAEGLKLMHSHVAGVNTVDGNPVTGVH
jgi:hypothetical protein